jgi:hypothetical protein
MAAVDPARRAAPREGYRALLSESRPRLRLARVSVSDMVIKLASTERGVTCIGSFKNSAPNFSPGPLQ